MKQKIIRVVLLLLGLAGMSIGAFFILKACGITNIDVLRDAINKTGYWAWLVFIAIRVPLTILLCFVPACSMLFDLLAVALFGVNIKSFIICLISIFLCSTVMYILGRTGANKLLEKIVGKEDLEKANKLIKEKGLVYYPIMMAVGGFPDDALVCMAGVTRMNFIYFLISTVVGRGIGCACTIFGVSLIPFASFTTFYDWFTFGCCLVVLGFVVIKLGNYISKKLTKKTIHKGSTQIDIEKLEEHRQQVESDNGSD